MFTQEFDSYVCDGDGITCVVDGFTAMATPPRQIVTHTP